MIARFRTPSGIEILNRVFREINSPLSDEASDCFNSLRFSPKDRKRMQVLATKAQRGDLTGPEHAEAEQYNLISHILALLQAKARQGKQPRGKRA